jgi:hypothetical protein
MTLASMKLPRSRGSQFYLLTLLGVFIGLVLVAFGVWRFGLYVVGATFVANALGRLVVPEAHKGMLNVRGRWFDVFWTTTLGVSLLILAAVVPGG